MSDYGVQRCGMRLICEAEHAELGRLTRERDEAVAECAKLREQKDGAYLERNQCVALIARMAIASGSWACVTRTHIDGWSADWHGCVYIGLPTGQVSWHFHDSQAHLFDGIPVREVAWDGHDTETKYARVRAALAGGGHE